MTDRGYANPNLLISPEALRERLEALRTPPPLTPPSQGGERNDGSTCVVDTRPTHEYMAGHIPGAVHFDLYGLSLNDTSERPFKAFMWMIGYLFSQRGVDPQKTIIWYEDISGTCAARGFWFCEYFGHKDVRVLDGGFNAWREAGGEISVAPVEPPDVAAFDTQIRPEAHINAEDIHANLGQNDFALLDTRSADEHYGRVARAVRGGAIPGSLHIEWRNNLDESGRFKSAAELRAMYAAAGITPDKRIMCY